MSNNKFKNLKEFLVENPQRKKLSMGGQLLLKKQQLDR